MGYYTSYTLTAKGKEMTQEVLNAMNAWLEERGVIGYALDEGEFGCPKNKDGNFYYAEFYSSDIAQWRSSEEDILDMSRAFPDFVFKLHGEGEGSGDLWNEYYHNGECEYCPAEIVYPEPQKIKWDDKCENIVPGTYVSIWDSGFEVRSSCKVNLISKEVFDIEIVNVEDLDCEILTGEFVIFNGLMHEVYSAEYELPSDVFWRA